LNAFTSFLVTTIRFEEFEKQVMEKMAEIERHFDSLEVSLNQTIRRLIGIEKTSGNLNVPATPHSSSGGFKSTSKTATMNTILVEIKAKMESLTAAGNTGVHSNETLNQLHSVKRSLQLELRTLRNRLDDLKREIQAENLETSSLLMKEVQTLNNYLAQVQFEERRKIREEILSNVTTAVELNDLNLALEGVKLFLPDEVEMAMLEVVRLIYDNRIGNFDKVLEFSQSLTPELYISMLKSLIDTMSKNGQVDQVQFIRLAYEVKGRLGSRLKNKFPTAIRGLVFGVSVCVRNLFTNQFLVPNWNEERESGGYLTETRKGTIGSVGRSQFCDWRIYPVNNAESFMIRVDRPPSSPHQILSEDEDQLNLSSQEGAVFIGNGDLSSNFFWTISTRSSGEVVNIELGTGTATNKQFLCAAPMREENDRNRRNLEMKRIHERACDWLVHNEL